MLVHVGFALHVIAEEEAERVLADLRILAEAEAGMEADAESGAGPPAITAEEGA